MGQGNGDGTNRIKDSVRRAIAEGVGRVSPSTADDIVQSLSKISQYLQQGEGQPIARQLAPDLMGTIGARGGTPSQPPGPAPLQPSPAPAPAPAPASGTPAAGGGGPTGRVGDVARATLSAIDFPSFV